MDFEFIYSNSWRLMTFGMAAATGFAFIINKTRRQPDAQLPHRQLAGWIMIIVCVAIAGGLAVGVFSSYGSGAAAASLILAPLVGGLLVFLFARS